MARSVKTRRHATRNSKILAATINKYWQPKENVERDERKHAGRDHTFLPASARIIGIIRARRFGACIIYT